ncbi:MAG: isoaspartyl peptidase/L-asparaginase family protein [Candidatus Asgardarchaeia archaeon]
MFGIVVHGGAGEIRKEYQKIVLNGVDKAVRIGFKLLKEGKSALDAVEDAVRYFEDDPHFNAGLGSALNLKGYAEMDAAIMDGKTLNAGATALVKNVAHPVTLARIIMENTDHVLIAGDAAEEIARNFGLEFRSPITERRVEVWKKYREGLNKNFFKKNYLLMKNRPYLFSDTVGAVALDRYGNLAAATSTGGIMMKLPGRIGDTSLLGAGNYAFNEGGAVSVTGIGEVAVRLNLAFLASFRMYQGKSADEALEDAMKFVERYQNRAPMGMIAIDRDGNVGINHLSKNLSWAFWMSDMDEPRSGIEVKSKEIDV